MKHASIIIPLALVVWLVLSTVTRKESASRLEIVAERSAIGAANPVVSPPNPGLLLPSARSEQELLDSIREHGRKAAANLSVKAKNGILNVRMKDREPRCRQLFQSWGLSESDANELMRIIREREDELLRHRYAMYADGLAGVKQFSVEDQTTRAVANVRIEQILGPERLTALNRLEQTIDSERLAKARGFLQD